MRSSLLNPVNPSSPELPRLLCAFHPEEQLTNFCKSKECLLPLCPACVSIHVGEHITAKTNPELQHINDSIRDLHSNLDTYTLQLNALYKHLVLPHLLRSRPREKCRNLERHFGRSLILQSRTWLSLLRTILSVCRWLLWAKLMS